jgi:hypothetical protein
VLAVTCLNVAPRDAVAGFTNGLPQISFTASTNQLYAFERSTNLVNWATIITNAVASDGSLRITDTYPPGQK